MLTKWTQASTQQNRPRVLQALSRLRNGKDVYANSRAAAKSLARDAYGNSKAYWEIHEYLPNAKKHFHDKINHSFHVFFG